MVKKRGLKINIKINLTNRWLYTFMAIGILAIISVGVYAYGTSNPSTFGHSSGEIDIDIDGDGTMDKTLQEAIDAGDFGGSADTRCDVSDVCSQVCIGEVCELSWPSGGSSLWQTSGDDIYYNSGNIGIGVTTPGAKLDVNGDIIITGKIKIVNRYSYKYDWNGRRDGHTSPRCACDTSDYQDCSYDQTYYTNTDYGSACYDWVDIKYAYNTQYRFPVTYGPYVVKTYG